MLALALAAVVAAGSVTTLPEFGTLRGRIVDSAGTPIANAQVAIPIIQRSSRSNHSGEYQFVRIPPGTYSVTFRAIGYRPRVVQVSVGEGTVVQDIVLIMSRIELAPVQVTATPTASSLLDSPQPVSVIQQDALRAAQAPSLGEVIDGQPGVHSYSTGNGIAKPVIRGLSGNRVLVLDNGQRMETQQWGDEHAPNIETATVERIEVIRGPASVLYGSDALGGVVNVVQRPLPDAIDRPATLNGRVATSYSSNGEMPEGSLLVEGATGGLGFRGTLSGRTAGNYSTPAGSLSNTGLWMFGGSGTVGYSGDWGSLSGRYSDRSERLEIHEDPAEEPDFDGAQRIRAQRAELGGEIALGMSRLSAHVGYEQNRRREFESAADEITNAVATGLLSRSLTADVHLHHALSAEIGGVVGVQGERIGFTKFGAETLIPDNTTTSGGIYGYEQARIGPWQFSLGARFDHRHLSNEADTDLDLANGERSWNSFTGNVGALYHLNETTALVLNLGRGFRAPSAYELFADGVHEGTVRYERGDPTLRVETSFNVDLALRFEGEWAEGEIGVYRNAINDYIHARPTGMHDAGSGFQIYQNVQGDALLSGFEAALELHATRHLHLSGTADYTRGQNTSIDRPLPLIPPLRLHGSVRYEGDGSDLLGSPYLQVGLEYNARQTRLDLNDTPTNSYTLGSASAGTGIFMGDRSIQLDVEVHNLFDTTYRPFLSRYKDYADAMGRNLIVRFGMDL